MSDIETQDTPAQVVAKERAKREGKKGTKLAPKVEAKGKVVRRTASGEKVTVAEAPAKGKIGVKAKAGTAKPKSEKKPRPVQVGGETVLRSGKLSARGLKCLCGCNQDTHTPDARFRSGHDAKLRQGLIEEGLDFSATPEIIRPFYERGEDVAGLRLAKGGKKLIDLKAEGADEE